ncbi:hypothetical protein Q8A73_018496 [Channa argus]|nr:hypothetical protein Q8A73_018496 [Channa argus]
MGGVINHSVSSPHFLAAYVWGSTSAFLSAQTPSVLKRADATVSASPQPYIRVPTPSQSHYYCGSLDAQQRPNTVASLTEND